MELFLWCLWRFVVGAIDAIGVGEAVPVIAAADFACLRLCLPIGDALAIGMAIPLAIGFGMAVAIAPVAPLIAPAAFDFAVLVPDAPF
jgi:hypothetical protein